MVKVILILGMVYFGCIRAYAQQVLTVNFTEVEASITNATSPFYYPTLMERFQKFDSTLTAQDFHHIYYGNYFQLEYLPYSTNESQKQLYNLLRTREFNEALIHGKLAFTQEPLNLKVLFGMYVCYSNLGETKLADNYLFLYYGLLSALFNSGDGKSVETAFVVLSVDDEYEMVASLNLRVKKQELVLGPTDVLHVEKNKSSKKKGPKYKRMYFNVSLPFMFLNKK